MVSIHSLWFAESIVSLKEVGSSTSFQEAVDSPKHKEWMDAIKDEMDSMVRNKVWELIDLPSQRKSIGNK